MTIVGKYTNLSESYKSLNEALFHSGIKNNVKVKIKWIDSRVFIDFLNQKKSKSSTHGISVPGGFGKDGSQGKRKCNKSCKKNENPFFWNLFWNAIMYIRVSKIN